MFFWLDLLIFGNGRGLGAPFWDARFYWLGGAIYSWIGGFGAQLKGFQWRHPKIGEERMLSGRIYRPFSSERQFLWLFGVIPTPIARVMVSWETKLPSDIDEANFCLSEIKRRLGDA